MICLKKSVINAFEVTVLTISMVMFVITGVLGLILFKYHKKYEGIQRDLRSLRAIGRDENGNVIEGMIAPINRMSEAQIEEAKQFAIKKKIEILKSQLVSKKYKDIKQMNKKKNHEN